MRKFCIAFIVSLSLCFTFAIGINTAAASDDSSLPSWVTNSKVKGDLRFRYQTEDREVNGEDIDRDRWRIRWRFGLESAPNDQWKVGFGLASGGNESDVTGAEGTYDPVTDEVDIDLEKEDDSGRSTNATLGNVFGTKAAQLDYAYIGYTPASFVEITFGKFKNPIWNPKDLLWDGDLMPEGIVAQFSFDASDNIEAFVTPAYLILDEEKNSEDDPNMMALQAGTKMKFGENISSKLGVTYYKFNDVDSLNDDDTAWSLEADAGFSGLPIYLGVFGQYITSAADDDNTGYLFGVKCGDKKVKKLWDWQAKYNYRRLEMYAWPDMFPDSDFLGGATGVEGSEIEVKLGLHKNVTLGLDYYMAEEIDGDKDPKLLQLDLIVKWP